MTQASKRTIKPQPMTEEQKQAAQTRFLLQKRETYAQGILYNLCNNPARADKSPKELAALAVDAADELLSCLLIKRLPELKEEKKEGE